MLPGRADVPRERVGLPVHVHARRLRSRCSPGAHLDPVSCSMRSSSEEITVTAGVPTIWMGILQALDAEPDRWDLSRMRSMIVGGAAAPQAMIEGFERAPRPPHHPRLGHDRDGPMGTISALSSQELGPARGRAVR